MGLDPVVLHLPFRGRWVTRNSPARRVPSHGTDLMGTTYAVDFVAVDEHDRSAPRTARSWMVSEPPGLFVGFGVPILAPIDGTVVAVHDGEPDHVARRSPVTLIPYALGQPRRVRRGPAAIAGNHVVIAVGGRGDGLGPRPGQTQRSSPAPARASSREMVPAGQGWFVTLVHLRRQSVLVQVGDVVRAGEQIGACGNSGNSTEPHVHVQVTDSLDWASAQGLPLSFRRPEDATQHWIPQEGEVVVVPATRTP